MFTLQKRYLDELKGSLVKFKKIKRTFPQRLKLAEFQNFGNLEEVKRCSRRGKGMSQKILNNSASCCSYEIEYVFKPLHSRRGDFQYLLYILYIVILIVYYKCNIYCLFLTFILKYVTFRNQIFR